MSVAIIPPTTKTGEWTASWYLINGLREREYDVRILDHFALRSTNRRVFLGSLLLKLLLKDDSISIVHNMDNLGPFLCRQKNLRAKKVLTVHDISPVMLAPQYERIVRDRVLRFYFTTILPKLVCNTDLILVDSYSTMRDLIEKFGVNKETLRVVHLGVDTGFFHAKNDYGKTLNKHNLRNSFLLYVGDDSPRKNLKTLVRAYCNTFQEISEDLVLIGPISENKIRSYLNLSDLPSHLKKEAQERIILLGYIASDDLPNIYSAATALLFPSLYEGFGLPPLEAMACKCPVVLSNNSSLQEVAGNAGLYIDDPLSCDEISSSILEIVYNGSLRHSLEFKGLEQAHKFSWEKTVQKTIKAYNSII